MAKQPWGGRPNKAALARMKVATAVVSVIAFAGSLGAVAYLNPGASAARLQSQAQFVSEFGSTGSSAAQVNSAPLQLPSRQQQASLVPLARTRGS